MTSSPTIRDLLLPRLAERFPGRGLRVGSPPDADATFPAAHPEVGDACVWDDGHEAMVAVGSIAHGHFSCFDEGLSVADRRGRVVDQVVGFLDALFADRVLVWKSPGPQPTSGGWRVLDEENPWSLMDAEDVTFLWSGPTPNPMGRDGAGSGPVGGAT